MFELLFIIKEILGVELFLIGRLLMEELLIIIFFNIIKYRSSLMGFLIDVVCVGDENIWIVGEDMWFYMMLYIF